jgi:NAD(P)-dependent dehydrogenase (short-subunit alcohol dehydrogenase family)
MSLPNARSAFLAESGTRERFDLEGKIALVTGASSGLGRRAAQVLAEHGAHVVVAGRRLVELTEVASNIRQKGGHATPFHLDVSDVGSIRGGLSRLECEIGPSDILVNNAGVSHQVPLLDVDETYFDWIMDTNLKGAFFVAQSAADQMIRHRREGRILNIASTGAESAFPNLTVYGMSKAAVVQMTRMMASELASRDINVNCICPGYIATAINPTFRKTDAGKHIIEHLPRGRPGRPEDLDGAVLLLSSSAASRLITGAVLNVDDGYSVI